MIQCRAALVITGTIKGTSRDLVYQEIDLESLADRRWSRKIFFFHKIVNGLLPSYLQSYLNHYNYGEYQTSSACQNKMKTLSLEEPKLLIRLFIHILLSNGVHLVKKFETQYQ